MPASVPDGHGQGQGEVSSALQELLRSSKQAEFEALYGRSSIPCTSVPEEPAQPPVVASLGSLDSIAFGLRSNNHNGSGADVIKLSGRRHGGGPAAAARLPGAAVPSSSSSPGPRWAQSVGGASPPPVQKTSPKAAGGPEIRRLHAELAAWGDELEKREAVIKNQDGHESKEELSRVRTEVAMQADQLCGIVEMLRRGLREADVSEVPRLIEGENEEDDHDSPKPTTGTSCMANPPKVQAEAAPFARVGRASPLGAQPRTLLQATAPPPVAAALLNPDMRLRPSSPVQLSSTRSPPQMAQLRHPVPPHSPVRTSLTRCPVSPPQCSRPRSPRAQSRSTERHNIGEFPSAQGSSQSRSNLRTMSPDTSVQTLMPPSVRAAAPPTSSTRHVISSRRTLPARMGGVPTAWFQPASGSNSAAPGTSARKAMLPSQAPGSVQLAAAGGGHSSRPTGSTATSGGSANRGGSAGPNDNRSSQAPSAPPQVVAAWREPPRPTVQPRTVQPLQSRQVLSSTPAATIPMSPGPSAADCRVSLGTQERRMSPPSWMPTQNPLLLKVRADFPGMPRQALPQQGPF